MGICIQNIFIFTLFLNFYVFTYQCRPTYYCNRTKYISSNKIITRKTVFKISVKM